MTSYLKTMLSGLRQWITAQKPDWSQNDETAANFIKGRPCYDTDPKMEYLVKDQTVTLEAMEGLADGWAALQLDSLIALEVGKTYNVTWDGKQYSVVSYIRRPMVFIGNLLILGGDDTGEPFFIATKSNSLSAVQGLGAGPHTFSIATMIPGETVPLPAKYLPQIPEEKLPPIPATIQRVGDPIILTDAQGVRWRLTVGTDGALTTEAVTE